MPVLRRCNLDTIDLGLSTRPIACVTTVDLNPLPKGLLDVIIEAGGADFADRDLVEVRDLRLQRVRRHR